MYPCHTANSNVALNEDFRKITKHCLKRFRVKYIEIIFHFLNHSFTATIKRFLQKNYIIGFRKRFLHGRGFFRKALPCLQTVFAV